MTTLSTHDTKRSEDVRARLAVLAEIPDEWAPRFRRWAAAHPLPDRSLDLLAWQNLVGAWPISAERLAAYLGKASREAKLVTSHVDPNAEVTPRWRRGRSRCSATPGPWRRSRSSSHGSTGRAAATRWARSCCRSPGPGVPDVYQGTELYEYSLVDPDNRRPVDWELRRQLLARIDGGWLPEFSREGSNSVDVDPEGATKLLVTAQALLLRRQRPELFAGYRSVPAEGPAAEHAIAFARSAQLVAVATRLPVGLAAARRLGGHRAAAAGRRRGLDGRAHRHARREQRPPARAGAGALPGRAAGPVGLTALGGYRARPFAAAPHRPASVRRRDRAGLPRG